MPIVVVVGRKKEYKERDWMDFGMGTKKKKICSLAESISLVADTAGGCKKCRVSK